MVQYRDGVGLARLAAILAHNIANDPEGFPSLEDLLPDEAAPEAKPIQTPAQMLAIMRGLARRSAPKPAAAQ